MITTDHVSTQAMSTQRADVDHFEPTDTRFGCIPTVTKDGLR